MTNYLTQRELIKATGLRYYQIEYLIKTEIIPVVLRGKGLPRLFPPEAIEIIRKRQERMRINNGS
ncbi:MAG: hypothetical protein ACTSUC_12100 [Promethearchaeota archaeon]